MAAKSGDLPGALVAFERAVATTPQSAEAWFLLGATLADLKRDAEAAVALRRAHAFAPGQIEVLGTLAYVEYRLNNFAAAAPLLEALSARRPDDLDAQLKLGDTLARLGHPAEAARVFRGAVAAHADDGGLWMALAQAEDEAGDRDAACAAYLASQTWRTSLLSMATVGIEIGKWSMAGKPKHERTRASPRTSAANSDPDAMFDLAQRYERAGQ